MILPPARSSRRSLLRSLGATTAPSLFSHFPAGAGYLPAAQPRKAPASEQEADLFVYGSTPGEIAAALEAARRGGRVVLACPQWDPEV